MRPYKTNPVLVERVWGGSRLIEYNKKVENTAIGESWETGPLEINTPVLIKLIDARDTLSVQVHPDDEFAFKAENIKNGKSEAWVILECDEEAFIIYGFNRRVPKEEFEELERTGLVSEVLNFVKVRKGDCIYIPAGTVHSLGKGILAYEVQQPSDITYRIFDWNRRDRQGKERELHIDKALEAISYSSELPQIKNIFDSLEGGTFNIINCKYFESSYIRLGQKETKSYESGSFRAITAVSGSIMLSFENMLIPAYKGDTCIIPEDYNETVYVEALEAAEYIVTTCIIGAML